jgi:hypothetical protein
MVLSSQEPTLLLPMPVLQSAAKVYKGTYYRLSGPVATSVVVFSQWALGHGEEGGPPARQEKCAGSNVAA